MGTKTGITGALGLLAGMGVMIIVGASSGDVVWNGPPERGELTQAEVNSLLGSFATSKLSGAKADTIVELIYRAETDETGIVHYYYSAVVQKSGKSADYATAKTTAASQGKAIRLLDIVE